MNSEKRSNNLLYKLGGYYLIPHELLHVVAYKIISKRYDYQWGAWQVKSLEPKNRQEKLFVLAFPFATCILFGFFFGFWWIISPLFIDIPPERYFIDGPTWHIIFAILSAVCFFYIHTCGKDLIQIYGWLFVYDAEYDRPEPRDDSKQSNAPRQEP
ncbi:hypothetical protein QUF64_14585 [Anaerolineales bacterium HSG6]|nr:hypothetical protein [Anaerolineales bacterium HSG6]